MTAGYDIYLMIGQSNMCGRGTAVDTLHDFNDPRVFQFGGSANNTRFRTIFLGNDPAHNEEYPNSGKVSPIFHFAKSVALQTPSDRRILLVPAARGGTTLMNNGPWASGNPGRPLYENAIAQANAAIIAAKEEYPDSYFKGIVWLQGEGDAVNHTQVGYSAALDAAMLGYRARITGAQNAAVVILQMVPDYVAKTNGNINRAHEDTPRRLDYAAFAYGKGGAAYQNGDDLHYNAAGSRLLGKAAAVALSAAVKNHPSFPLVPPACAPIVKNIAGNSVTLTFDAPLCQFDSFKIEYRAGESAWTTAPAPMPTALGTRVRTVDGLALGVNYEFRVSTIAKNALVSAPSPSVFVSINNVVPSKILNLRSLSTSSSSITLAWDSPAEGGTSTDYKIEYKFSSSAEWITYADGVNTNLQCGIDGLLQETGYDFRVSGYNAVGYGEVSDILSISTNTTPPTTAESGAQGHWLFGLDNPTFSDLVSGSLLLKNGAEPTLANGSMVINGNGAGLLTAFDETPDCTLCLVVKRDNVSAILGGTLKSNSGGAGISPFLSARATSPAICFNERGGFGNLALDGTMGGFGQYVFVAFSISATGNRVLFMGKPAGNAINVGVAPRALSVPVRKISIGDVYYNATTFAGNATIAEAILFNMAKTESELNDIYLRSKERLGIRGIGLY